jgi:hypothetical protein
MKEIPMSSTRVMQETDVFMPWDKELFVEIENKGIVRSLTSEGSTLFDHIFDVYLRLIKTIPHSNLDDFISCLEIKEFSRSMRYIKVKINNKNALPHHMQRKISCQRNLEMSANVPK